MQICPWGNESPSRTRQWQWCVLIPGREKWPAHGVRPNYNSPPLYCGVPRLPRQVYDLAGISMTTDTTISTCSNIVILNQLQSTLSNFNVQRRISSLVQIAGESTSCLPYRKKTHQVPCVLSPDHGLALSTITRNVPCLIPFKSNFA